jgi:multiple sugar transport system permease protein
MTAGPRMNVVLFHTILAVLSVLFALPFLWMVSTSFKADDEIVRKPTVWIPELPMRVRESPYLDFEAHPPRWERPAELSGKLDWEAVKRELRGAFRGRADDFFRGEKWPHSIGQRERILFAQAMDEIENLLWETVRPRIPDEVWKSEDPISAVVGQVDVEDVANAWNRVYRALALGKIELRNPQGEIVGESPRSEEDRIPYEIQNAKEPILLADREIRMVSPEEEIEQAMVRVKGDVSYHRLRIELDAPGAHYETERPAFLSSGEYQDLFMKFRDHRKFEVDHIRLVERQSNGPAPDNRTARMRFYLIPTSYPVVLWERLMESYREVFAWVPYATYMWVTVKLTVLNIVGQLFACSMVAFAFARMRFPGRDVLFILMLSTMMLPPQVTMIPQFVEFSKIGAYNTLFPLYIFSFAGAPFFIFLMRQFYLTIPNDLTDAAKIDGCGYFTMYWRILLPLLKPALAAVAIFQFQATWNEFLQPLIYIADTEKTPLSLGLFLFRQSHGGLSQGGGHWAELMAASALMTVPIILLFFFTQRYFIQGVTLTGLKQ